MTGTIGGGGGPLETVERIASGRWGLALVAGWGFAEATFLPVIPDVAIGLLALAAPRRTLPLLVALVGGALAGSLLLYTLAVAAPDAVEAILLALPAISDATIGDARGAVADGAPQSMVLVGPGTPLKVYTYAWAMGPGTVLGLAAGVVLNRVTRIAPGLLLLAVIGSRAPSFLRRHQRLVIGVYAVSYLVGYALYWR